MLNRQIFDEMKSPMYATSIGLLIKGILAVEEEEAISQERGVKKSGKVPVQEIADKQSKKESWFTKIISEFIKDNQEIDDDSFIGKK